ncbi:hypothetical protein AB0A74_37465 [Saccharothrix sp. NPDC042600]|uniref:hypothetical protein n=1 Tax=Saccharothrix TaxID=2071 RepID=UPI00341023B5|nr:hypothetical protein GCM10017745_60080 [Saccharothrix mutabilis subsp. capreolus]
MTAEPVNPFSVAPFPSAMQPLNPVDHDHDHLYVDVDSTGAQYLEFQRQMGDLTSVLDHGRIVLATGERGCGKSALLNRCAAWVVAELKPRGVTAKVVDTTTTFAVDQRMGVTDRIIKVCDRLFDVMRREGLIRPDALDEFRENRREPHRVYDNLGYFMPDRHVLVLRLPSPEDLWQEVVSYASLVCGGVLFLVESAHLDREQVRRITRETEALTKPVVLEVGPLVDGDARKFIEARLNPQGIPGRFPRMSDQTVVSAGHKFATVAQLQRTLHSTYEFRMSQADYDDGAFVTIEDILDDVKRRSGDGSGAP